MFTGRLPDYIVAAMSAIFDLEDDGQDLINDALLEYAGEAIDEMQLEIGPPAP